MNIEYASDRINVVRCKDCWKQGLDNCPMEFYWDSHPADDTCYCAMGERKNEGKDKVGMIQIDMEMPKCCDECFALDEHGDYPFCLISQDQRGYTFNTKEKRMPTCPLKEEKPRVMTIEELKTCDRETIWLQVKSNHTIKQLTQDGIAALIFIGLLHNWNGYGTVWCCWTFRPTDAQMEEMKWDY